MTKTILICGGAGYIGSHMSRLLRSQGFETVILDNLSTGHPEAVRGGTLVKGDIRDEVTLDSVFRRYRFEAVLHFCAKSLVGESLVKPLEYYENNVNGSVTLLRVMLRHNVRKMVFSSTAAIFGEPQSDFIDESHPTIPLSPYGKSKLMVEDILSDAVTTSGLSAATLRYFNAAGATESGVIGESHQPETHLIPNVLMAVLSGAAPLKVFGGDYDTWDGTCVRDYIHVDDLANAHLLALSFLEENPGFHAFNLGNGQGFSVLDIIRAAGAVVGRNIQYDVVGRREGDPASLVASNASARKHLGWRPERSDLETIIRSAWKWHKCQRF